MDVIGLQSYLSETRWRDWYAAIDWRYRMEKLLGPMPPMSRKI